MCLPAREIVGRRPSKREEGGGLRSWDGGGRVGVEVGMDHVMGAFLLVAELQDSMLRADGGLGKEDQ